MQDVITINNYAEFEQKFDNIMQETAEKFVVIGYMLKVARDTDVLRESGYSTMGEFAQKRYGLTKDIASRYIAINDRYSEGGYSEQLDPKYKAFGYAKLAEMLTLPDTIVGEISPEMTKTDIRAIKEEVRAEQATSDIEVLIEEKDQSVEAIETTLGKIIYQYCYENPDIFKNLWGAINERTPEIEYLLDVLAPSGLAMLSCRIPGTSRLMLSIKGLDKNLKVINIRGGEKEEFSWEELMQVAVAFLQTNVSNWKVTWRDMYNEEPPEEKPEVAPAQPESKHVVKAKVPEKPKEAPKKEQRKAEPVAEEQLPGRMEVGDYPEMMPEPVAVQEETDEHTDGNTGRNPESVLGNGEKGKADDKGPGIPANEQETPQSNGKSSEKEIPKTLKSAKELEETVISENDYIRRTFTVFSRGKVPLGELEVAKDHAEKLLIALDELIGIKGRKEE